jgi:hypothetical protein
VFSQIFILFLKQRTTLHIFFMISKFILQSVVIHLAEWSVRLEWLKNSFLELENGLKCSSTSVVIITVPDSTHCLRNVRYLNLIASLCYEEDRVVVMSKSKNSL